MKGIRFQGQLNVHAKRVNDYAKRNQTSSATNCCGSTNDGLVKTKLVNLIKSIKNNSVTFHPESNQNDTPERVTITYYSDSTVCGNC
jgi:hypothetical protein